jgi:hypothetical protein
MQIEDKRKAKAKLQATCNSYAERNSSICFCKLCPSMELRYEWVCVLTRSPVQGGFANNAISIAGQCSPPT